MVAAGPALSAVSRDCRRACSARGRRWAGSLRSVQRLQQGLRRRRPQCPETAEGPAVSRDCRRACGARGRRWAGSLRSVQRLQKGLQCPETAKGPAARVVAAGPALSTVSRDCSLRRAWSPLGRLSPQCGARGRRWAGCLRSVQRLQKGLRRALSAVSRDCRRAGGARGRRWAGSLHSVQRLQKGLRRAWSPLGRLSPQCPETAEGPAARVVAAGPALSAVSRDCRRACGAEGRSVQRLQKGLQCPETAEGPAARVVAAGPALSTVSRDCRRVCGARGRRWAGSLRSVQRLQKGLRRAWSPLGRLSPQCPETAEGPAAQKAAVSSLGRLSPQCPETAEGPAAQKAAVSRDCRRACSVQRLQKGLRRAWSPLGRLSPQCPETADGSAARVVAAGPALSAVSRDCRRACGARGRRWAGSLRSVQRLQKGLQCPETAEGPRDCRRACGARGRRWAGSLRSVQRLQKGLRRAWSPLGRLSPQCPETAEGPAARVVAAGPGLSAVSRDCRRAGGARGRRWAPGGSVSRDCRRPQCPETTEGPAARVVSAGPALSAVSRDCKRLQETAA